jgi:hypothetical protein
MKSVKSARVALALAIAVTSLSAFSAFGSPLAQSAFAQSEEPSQESSGAQPVVTPVPLSTPTEAPTPEATAPAAAATPTPANGVSPEGVDAGEIWTPGSGNFNISINPVVSVTVSAPYALDSSTAVYQLVVGGVYQGVQPVPTKIQGPTTQTWNLRVDTSSLSIGGSTQIVFSISGSGNPPTVSPLYGLTRGLFLPIAAQTSPPSLLPTNLSSYSGSNTSCPRSVGQLLPNTTYTALAGNAEAWYYAAVSQPNSTLVVSLTNFTVAGQLQVFVPQANGLCSTLTPNPQGFAANPNPVVTVPNVPVSVVYFRVVITGLPPNTNYQIGWTSNQTTIGPFANNYNPCTAVPILPNVTYTAYADNQYDFFALDLPVQGTIAVTVTNFPVANSQLQIRSPLLNSACSPTGSTSTLEFGVLQPNQTLTLFEGNLSPNRYYARVNLPTSTPPSPPQPFLISWGYIQGTSSGVWNPNFTTNPVPYQPDICLNIASGGSCTYYWNGMGGDQGTVTAILMQIVAVTNLVGCGPGNPSTVLPSGFANNFASVGTTAPSGSKTFTFPTPGGYNVNIRVQRVGQPDYNDGKPLKVGCGLVTLEEYMQVSKNLSFDVPRLKEGDPVPLILPDP